MTKKTKEVIVLAFQSRTTFTPLLLTYENESVYLHIDSQGCTLFGADSPEPYYKIQEPLLLAHGIMTDSETVHLVVLKTNGELCYTLIPRFSAPQTTLIAKLDVRATKYRRLFLFAQGKMIHIFYACSHQAIRDLWRIEHRFWNGATWNSVHLGEVVHPREPLYHVNIDGQGNLHLLTLTFQGRYSLLFTNRFNGTFHIWGSPTETLKISGEVVDMAALMTSDNVHHLFWVVKTPSGQFEVRWAQQTNALELTGNWHPSPAPIRTFPLPWRNIGSLEINGVIWLLIHTEEETLLLNDGAGWRLVSSHSPFHRPIQWVHNGKRNFHQTYWLENQAERHTPVYQRELGLALSPTPQLTPFQSLSPKKNIQIPPPPVPAFYPEVSSSTSYPVPPLSIPDNSSPPSPPIVTESPSDAAEKGSEPLAPPLEENIQPQQPAQENPQLEQLITTVAHLEQENSNLSLTVQSMLSKFDQILGALSENIIKSRQESAVLEDSIETSTLAEIPVDELEPFKEAMANLEKETESLSQVLRVMLAKQEESDSSLENLGVQISQLQEKTDQKNRGGFWNKWIT
ncbi:hypothetical protein [Desulfosporosinus sp. SB140]|uniref:hypothetical protein n=1 Tax=Desulfosporosinus paludis TaxID=3115649 RepID=UPI0038902D9B